MKQLGLILVCFVLGMRLIAQPAVPMAYEAWKTTLGTTNIYLKNNVKTDPYENIITAGSCLVNGTYKIQITKQNKFGVLLWQKTISGLNLMGNDGIGSLYVTDTYIYITGIITNNTVTPEPDCYTAKLATSTGSVVWSATYSGGYGIDGGKFISVSPAGDVYVTGLSYNASMNSDILSLKYNGTTGAQSWVHLYNYSSALDDSGIKMVFSGSNVTIGGVVTSATNNYKLVTLSLSQSTGSLLATTTSTAVTTSSVDAVADIAVDNAGNTIIVGSQFISGQGNNFYAQKLTGNLTPVFTYTWSSAGNYDDYAKAIAIDAANNIFVAGLSSSAAGRDLTLLKLNSSGVLQNTVTSGFSGDDEASDMVIDRNADVYLTGYKANATFGDKNYYTVKYSNACAKVWEKETDGHHFNDNATNITMDSLNNVIITGLSEISLGNFEFLTVKYVQHSTVAFTDINSESIDPLLLFLPNKGQLINTNLSNETDILYYNLTNYPETYIAKNRISFLQFHRDTIASTIDSLERIDLVFNHSNPIAEIFTEDNGSDNNYNYFTGSITVPGLHSYNKLISPDIYTGIDLHYYSNAYGVKSYFVVKPNADPRQIEFLLQGQQTATVTSTNLKIMGLLGDITLRKPNVYNINGGANVPVAGTGWTVSGNTVTINTGTYTLTQPLVIEFSNTGATVAFNASPVSNSDNVDWCTYVGNAAADGFSRMAMDKYNNKYMAGITNGNNYPTTANVYSGSNLGGTTLVITKFDHLNKMLHSTYYGGYTTSSNDTPDNQIGGIAVDSLQNVFVAGWTNTSNFPFPPTQPAGSYHYTSNPANSTNSGNSFITSYIVKLDTGMQNNLWGTHVGNTYLSRFNDLMVDKNQNVTAVGYNTSSGTTFNFPTIPANAYSNTLGEGLLFRFSNNGVPQYATRTSNRIIRIADNKKNGDYFIATKLNSGDPAQEYVNPGAGAYYDNTVYLNDFYLARFNHNDSITWATVFGGIHQETVYDMALRDSTLILVGTSDGIGFPIKSAPGQYVDSVHTNTGATDFDIAFVRFNSYTGKHIYSSYFGGNTTHDYAACCTIDPYGNYYIGGYTQSNASNFALQASGVFYYSGTFYNNKSGFILSYAPNNNKRLTTYLAGNQSFSSGTAGANETYMYDMDISSAGDMFVIGSTTSNRYFPIYDASSGVAYMDTVKNNYPTDAYIASFRNLNAAGIHNLDKNNIFGDVLVYPNPSSDIYNIEMEGLESNKSINFNVYNALGQMVYKEDVRTPDTFIKKQINLGSLTHGIYFINILQDNKNITVKVIKQ